MIRLFSFCFVVFLAGSFNLVGQTTNKEAEDALAKGLKAYENNKVEAAIKLYTKAIKLDPDFAEAYYNRGEANSY